MSETLSTAKLYPKLPVPNGGEGAPTHAPEEVAELVRVPARQRRQQRDQGLPCPPQSPSGLPHHAGLGKESVSLPNALNKCKQTRQMEQMMLDP